MHARAAFSPDQPAHCAAVDRRNSGGRRVRVNGTASVVENDDLIDAYPYAQFIVRVKVREVFPNCPRYIHHYQLVERSRFVPRKTSRPPVPDWKRSDWACDVLPENDPAREPAAADQPHI